MMTREQVEECLEQFLELVAEEQAVKEELLALQMRGHRATQDEISGKIARHDELIAEIGRIRNEQMLPILEKLTRFIGASRIRCVA